MLNIGDRVKFLSDTGVAVITKIEKNLVWVETEDGFEIPVSITDVVAVSKEQELEAIARIGSGDERPGSKKAKHQSKKDRPIPVKEREAYKRYGKISLVDEGEMEDEEDLLDMHDIKAKYVKNLMAQQQRAKEIEQEELLRNENMARVIESGEPTIENVFEPEKPILQAKGNKPRTMTLEQLAETKGETTTIKQHIKKTPKPTDDIEVVDLHANEVLESEVGMSSGEIITAQLSRFTISLDSCVKTGKRGKIVYIHGVGKGKLRYEIERKLRLSYPKLSYQDASFAEYGFGAILIMY